MASKPLMIQESAYNKLCGYKTKERWSMTQVIEHLCTEIERLRTQNTRLMENRISILEDMYRKDIIGADIEIKRNIKENK